MDSDARLGECISKGFRALLAAVFWAIAALCWWKLSEMRMEAPPLFPLLAMVMSGVSTTMGAVSAFVCMHWIYQGVKVSGEA